MIPVATLCVEMAALWSGLWKWPPSGAQNRRVRGPGPGPPDGFVAFQRITRPLRPECPDR
jgi:hypothetical protein